MKYKSMKYKQPPPWAIKTPWAIKIEQFNPYTYFGNAQWWDNYYQYSPDDSDKWLKFFELAGIELRSILMVIRNTGAQLIPDDRFGYKIQPVIGPQGWATQQEYDEYKQQLGVYRNEIIKILGVL